MQSLWRLHAIKFRPSLKLKLLGVLVPIAILPVVLASFGWYETMFRSSMRHSGDITYQYTHLVASNISQYTDSINRALDPLLIDVNFQRFMKSAPQDTISQARYALAFEPLLESFMQTHKEVPGILYMDTKGKILYQSYQKSMNYIYPFEDDPFFEQIADIRSATLSTVHITEYVLGAPEESLSVIRPAIDLSNGQIYAWLIVNIRADYFRQLMQGANPGQDGQIALVHPPSGAIVAGKEMDAQLLYDVRSVVASSEPGAREAMLSTHHAAYQVVMEPLSYGDWRLVWVTPLEAITEGVSRSLRWTLLIAAAALLLCIVVAFPTMRVVLRPMDKLIGGMRHLSRGQYEPIAQPPSQDEIGFLISTYNHMLAELERMEREVYQAQLKEREKEVLQLQAQTNPHFFFNTLETIELYAARRDGNAVSEMVQSVSRMMRYNVRNDGGWTTLREEAAFIRDFLSVHARRNGAAVRTEWNIEPALLEMPIMRLSLQPFVENALKYGWSPALPEDRFTLKIAAWRSGTATRFLIEDTGIGMDPGVLATIQRLLARSIDGTAPFFQEHTGIYNVYRRLMLVYGPRVQISFAGGTAGGAKVEIAIEDETSG